MLSILAIVVIFVAVCSFFCLKKKKKKHTIEAMRNHCSGGGIIRFMSQAATQSFLVNDPDFYIRNMTVYDLRARGVVRGDDYIRQAVSASQSFSPKEKMRLLNCVQVAEQFFINLDKKKIIINKNIRGLHIPSVLQTPWIFAKTKERVYENGYPHTRMDVIFIPSLLLDSDDVELTRTLIHEKIHVYQRHFPILVKKYVSSIDCEPLTDRQAFPFARANPDLDSKVYRCKGSETWLHEYNSEWPKDINDTKLSQMQNSEHPYEHMAYFIASLFSSF